jgi:proteasome accessory factor B
VSRVERLLNLTSALLHTRRPLRADEIHETIPGYPSDKVSFRRQFERDKEALRQLGLPLITEDFDGSTDEAQVGYRIRQDEYFLRDPGLTPEELSALHLAAQKVRYADDASVSALWKLGRPTGGDAEAVTNRNAVEAAAELPSEGPLALLFESIAEKRPISFHYKSERRTVAGRRLAFRNGHWYLTAYDPARSDDRSFRVDRMDEPIELSSEQFEVPEPAAEPQHRANPFDAPWELGDNETTVAHVLLEPPHAQWALGRLGAASVVSTSESGSMVFRLHVRNKDAFRSFVLGFLDHAEVLSPEELRLDLLAWIDAGIGSQRDVSGSAEAAPDAATEPGAQQ